MTSRTVTIGGKTYTLTPMTIGERKRGTRMALAIQELSKKGALDPQRAEEFSELMLDMIFQSLRRAAPAVTREEIEDNLSDEEAISIFATLCLISMPSDFSMMGASHLKN
jgi:hypothetical protein